LASGIAPVHIQETILKTQGGIHTMQVMGVTGKIYGLKPGTTGNGKPKVSWRLSVRKSFVTDQEKTENKTNTFLPMIAMGPTAEFITKYFKDGDSMSVGSMEYQTYRTANAPNEFDDAHIFKVDKVGFVGDNNAGGNTGSPPAARQPAAAAAGGRSAPARQPATTGGGEVYNPNDDLPF
jgi:single-stranded DNA-binding protein